MMFVVGGVAFLGAIIASYLIGYDIGYADGFIDKREKGEDK
jgi:hypothetical protein